MAESEVARLLRQIDLEYEAAERGLGGLAEVAHHAFITARMEQIDRYHVALQGLVGEHEAIRLLAQAVMREEAKGHEQG